jgi:glutathione peroxidase
MRWSSAGRHGNVRGVGDFFDLGLRGLDGATLDLDGLRDRAVLVVNVASRCGLAPQYAGLESLQRRYAERGFAVLGVPCNQFANQEPGGEDEIREFCSATYGTTFPMTEKLEVNGRRRHPLYRQLVDTPDGDGRAGDIEWNFEKFLVSPSGEVRARFRPPVEPESAEVTEAIEGVLSAPSYRRAERWEMLAPSEVVPGDRVRPRPGVELTVTRIEPVFLGRDGRLAFIEASEDQWLKAPAPAQGDVEVLRRLP